MAGRYYRLNGKARACPSADWRRERGDVPARRPSAPQSIVRRRPVAFPLAGRDVNTRNRRRAAVVYCVYVVDEWKIVEG